MTSDVEIRWMIRAEMPEILDIERACFDAPWTEKDFMTCLQQRNAIGTVAERGRRIVGFMIYELLPGRLHVLNFAVDPLFQRQGIGSKMMGKLAGKLADRRRDSITLEIRESNLPGQLFFRSRGFRAVSILRSHYEDIEEDAYRMRLAPYERQADASSSGGTTFHGRR